MIKLFECIVGSRAYGTNIATSDTDIKGVYIQDNQEILGLKYQEQVQPDKDTTYYEIRRFIELLGSANPTLLEMVFVDNQFIKYCHPAFQTLIDNRHKFLTKKCNLTFGGMAIAQIKKAKGTNKLINWEEQKMIRKKPIDFCLIAVNGKSIDLTDYLEQNNMKHENCGLVNLDRMIGVYALYYSDIYKYRGICFENSNHIVLSNIPKGEKSIGIISYNADGYSQHCKKYLEFETWKANYNSNRFVQTVSGEKIDSKNMMHCVRLLQCAEEIARTGNLTVFRSNRDELLNIRLGNVPLDKLIILLNPSLASAGLKHFYSF